MSISTALIEGNDSLAAASGSAAGEATRGRYRLSLSVALNLHIALREGALFLVLLALGSGVTALLPAHSRVSRLALAPAVGLAVGSSGLAALSFFVPLEHACCGSRSCRWPRCRSPWRCGGLAPRASAPPRRGRCWRWRRSGCWRPWRSLTRSSSATPSARSATASTTVPGTSPTSTATASTATTRRRSSAPPATGCCSAMMGRGAGRGVEPRGPLRLGV